MVYISKEKFREERRELHNRMRALGSWKVAKLRSRKTEKATAQKVWCMSFRGWLSFEPRSSLTPRDVSQLSLSAGTPKIRRSVPKSGREVRPKGAGSGGCRAEAKKEKVSKMEPKEPEPKMRSSSLGLQVLRDFCVSHPKFYLNCLCWKFWVCLGQRNTQSAATTQNSPSSHKTAPLELRKWELQ